MTILIPMSVGEIWDKYSILLIKREKIKDKTKLAFIETEINYLEPFMKNYDISLFTQLKTTNEQLWNIEDRIRVKEYEQAFDTEFIELARSVYITNDKRYEIKKKINIYFNSVIHEIKDYVLYE